MSETFVATPAFIAYIDLDRHGIATDLGIRPGEEFDLRRSDGSPRCCLSFRRPLDRQHPGLDRSVDATKPIMILDSDPATIDDAAVENLRRRVTRRPSFATGTVVGDRDDRAWTVTGRDAYMATLTADDTGETKDVDVDEVQVFNAFYQVN